MYSSVVAGIGRIFAAPAQELAAQIERAPDRILDIGCGSGVWSLAIAERFERARVTGLDLPDVLAVFEARATERGLRDRIEKLGGDMHAVAIPPAAFDLVIIANVLRLELLKPRDFRGDVIDADRDAANPVDAFGIRMRGERGGRSRVAGRDPGARNRHCLR